MKFGSLLKLVFVIDVSAFGVTIFVGILTSRGVLDIRWLQDIAVKSLLAEVGVGILVGLTVLWRELLRGDLF